MSEQYHAGAKRSREIEPNLIPLISRKVFRFTNPLVEKYLGFANPPVKEYLGMADPLVEKHESSG